MCLIQKPVSILLSLLFILGSFFPQMDIEEVYKIPQVFYHYQSEHPEISFLAFLQKHYGFENSDNQQHEDEHGQEHEKLPLKSDHHTHFLAFICLIVNFTQLEFKNHIQFQDVTTFFITNYSFLEEFKFLYPPQLFV